MLGGEWTGYEEAMAELKRIANEVFRDDVIERALLEGVADPMAAEMEKRLYTQVDRRTGEIGASIQAKSLRDRRAAAGEVVVGIGPSTARGSDGWKVKFYEFGTSKLSPRPFMRPVYEEWRSRITERFVAAIKGAYQAAVAGRPIQRTRRPRPDRPTSNGTVALTPETRRAMKRARVKSPDRLSFADQVQIQREQASRFRKELAAHSKRRAAQLRGRRRR